MVHPPLDRTWRPSGDQWNRSAACGSLQPRPFRDVWCEKKTSPRSSKPFSSTIRTDGAPPGVAVASAIASGTFERRARLGEPAPELLERVGGEIGAPELGPPSTLKASPAASAGPQDLGAELAVRSARARSRRGTRPPPRR
jgi:hypothetical protein